MEHYTVRLRPAATRVLRKLDRTVRQRLLKALEGLESDPFPVGVKALQGHENGYRIRVGDCRIVDEVRESELLVRVLQLGHRREVYRKL